MSLLPLPQRPPPVEDELFSSWLARLALANHCPLTEFCGYLGLKRRRPPERRRDLDGVDLARLGTVVRLTVPEIEAMIIEESRSGLPETISRAAFQVCPDCHGALPGIHLRHWRNAWALECEYCGMRLRDAHGQACGQGDTRDLPARLWARAARGAEVLHRAHRAPSAREVRRIQIAIGFTQTIEPSCHSGALTSSDQRARFTLLAAIGEAIEHPLLKAAVRLREDEPAVRRLWNDLRYHRRWIARVLRVRDKLNRRLPPRPRSRPASTERSNHAFRDVSPRYPRPAERYLRAAHQAIEALGPQAPERELLKAAAGYLDRARANSVSQQSSLSGLRASLE